MAMLPWWIHYPNVNNEIINLDWILQVSNENTDKIENFIGVNTIKYADPILWDITSQYEANTIVVDPQTGDAYISTKAVPYGVALSNEGYWTRIYNYASELHVLRDQIAYDEQLSTTATGVRVVDDLVFLNGLLYRVTAPMIAGDSYVEDSNCVKTTINAELLRLHTSISAEAEARAEADTAEAEARAEADTALGQRIDDEAEARAEADTALGQRIDDEAEARAEADTALGQRIDDEAEARQNAISALESQIAELAPKYIFDSLASFENSETDFKLDDIIYITSTNTYFKIVENNNVLCVATGNNYAELQKTNGFINLNGLELATNTDLYDILTYLIENAYYKIILPKGRFTLSDTITISPVNNVTPQLTITTLNNRDDTYIRCTRSFIICTISGSKFRYSEFSNFTCSANIQEVGSNNGTFGLRFMSASNTPNDMFDFINIHDVQFNYFGAGIQIETRCIWNKFENILIHYCTYGFVYQNADSSDGFFNQNTFINCQFEYNARQGLFIHSYSKFAMANSIIGSSIEQNFYSNTSFGNVAEADISGCSIEFIACYFEKISTLGSLVPICATNKSNVNLKCCSEIGYGYGYTKDSTSQLIIEQTTVYNSAMTNYGGTTATVSNTFTIT